MVVCPKSEVGHLIRVQLPRVLIGVFQRISDGMVLYLVGACSRVLVFNLKEPLLVSESEGPLC